MTDRVKGPASYFPSIETTCGCSFAELKSIVRQRRPGKHTDLVAMLKRGHGMGRGRANALVAHRLAGDPTTD